MWLVTVDDQRQPIAVTLGLATRRDRANPFRTRGRSRPGADLARKERPVSRSRLGAGGTIDLYMAMQWQVLRTVKI